MKRKNEEVPGFDEIIFKDRNKEYGAYRIRKGYNKSLGISLLGGVALAVILVVLPSLTAPKGSALPPTIITVSMPDPFLDNVLKIEPPEEKHASTERIISEKYVAPVVTSNPDEITKNLRLTEEQNKFTSDLPPDEGPVVYGNPGPVIPPEPEPFIAVEEMPEFPGGNMALLKYIADNVIYPIEAIENKVEGKVILRFVVSSTGTIEKIQVLKSTGTALDLSILENEAIRVIRTMPLWEPGKQGGVPVPVFFSVPVTFSIQSF